MDIIDAYVLYCEEHDIGAPTEKMQTHLRVRIVPKKWVVNDVSLERVHKIKLSISKLHGGEDPNGVGENFDEFCIAHGRPRPSSDQIATMNVDSFEGAQQIRADYTNPLLYRALVSFRARGGF